jgi:hypothetical protein
VCREHRQGFNTALDPEKRELALSTEEARLFFEPRERQLLMRCWDG